MRVLLWFEPTFHNMLQDVMLLLIRVLHQRTAVPRHVAGWWRCSLGPGAGSTPSTAAVGLAAR